MFTQQQARSALWAGSALILMALLAGVSLGGLFPQLYVAGDAAKTYNQLQQHFGVLDLFLACFGGVCILDWWVAVWLYQLTKSTRRSLAGIMSGLRFIYTVFMLVAMGQLIGLHQPSMTIAETYTAFSRFMQIWSIGLAIFGGHLLLWGILFLQSDRKARIPGVLLVVAGVSYVLVHGCRQFPPTISLSQTMERVLALPMALGELYAAGWLIYQGIKSFRLFRKSVS